VFVHVNFPGARDEIQSPLERGVLGGLNEDLYLFHLKVVLLE
jgi:hypothetical protein